MIALPPPPDSETPQSPESSSGDIVRKYTAPTCTLEIAANASVLARWTHKPTLKNQRFNLRFNDPRLGEDQWVVLRGDRLKLEALTNEVAHYVQTFLTRSPNFASSENVPVGADSVDSALTGVFLPEHPQTYPQGITLQPKGLLAHTLTLGTLATEATGPNLVLTSTQLADLASVLDEHSAQTIALPVLTRDFAWTRSPAAWGKIAAGALLSVGLTATVLNQFGKSNQQPIVATSASSNDQRTAPVPLPVPTSSFPPTPLNTGNLPVQVPSNIPDAGAIASNQGVQTSPSPKSELTQENPEKGTAEPKPVIVPKTTSTPQGTTVEIPEGRGANPSLVLRKPTFPASAQTAQGVPVKPLPGSSLPRKANDSADPEPLLPIDRSAQLGEIQDQVSLRWNPPETLSKDVEYLLTVQADGTVESIAPVGEIAQKYSSSVIANLNPLTELPPISGSYKVRVVLSASGSPTDRVKAYIVP